MFSFLGVFCALAVDVFPASAFPPPTAKKFLPDVIRAARFQNLDPAVVAGQIHQESSWNSSAASVDAAGLAQITPQTERFLVESFGRGLKNGEGPKNPRWAIRAITAYDRWLLDRTAQGWNPALRAYNGGLGWLIKERSCSAASACDTCCRQFRSAAACAENCAYPELVLGKWAPRYRTFLNHFGG